jgi:phosphoribosyl 1,2-cyclic phosphate phosphodiesterase
MMEVLFLGTGTSTGIPYINCPCEVCQSTDSKDKRLRASVLVSVDNKEILIDCGPDFRQQAIANDISSISAVLLTHEHFDHVTGIDDLRAYGEVEIYAEERVCHSLKRTIPYCFSEIKYPGVPIISLHEIDETSFDVQNTRIIPIRIWHHKLPILGFRIGNFAYLTDISGIDEIEYEKLQNLDVLVVDALRIKPHFSHFTLEQAVSFAQKTNAKRVYFTHISHQLGKHDEIENTLPQGMYLAYDGLKISI